MAKVRVLLRQNNTIERCTLLGLGNSELCNGAFEHTTFAGDIKSLTWLLRQLLTGTDSCEALSHATSGHAAYLGVDVHLHTYLLSIGKDTCLLLLGCLHRWAPC